MSLLLLALFFRQFSLIFARPSPCPDPNFPDLRSLFPCFKLIPPLITLKFLRQFLVPPSTTFPPHPHGFHHANCLVGAGGRGVILKLIFLSSPFLDSLPVSSIPLLGLFHVLLLFTPVPLSHCPYLFVSFSRVSNSPSSLTCTHHWE